MMGMPDVEQMSLSLRPYDLPRARGLEAGCVWCGGRGAGGGGVSEIPLPLSTPAFDRMLQRGDLEPLFCQFSYEIHVLCVYSASTFPYFGRDDAREGRQVSYSRCIGKRTF